MFHINLRLNYFDPKIEWTNQMGEFDSGLYFNAGENNRKKKYE